MTGELRAFVPAVAVLAVGLLLALFRRRAAAGVLVLVGSLVAALVLGVLSRGAPLAAFPLLATGRLALALALGALARAAGGPRLPAQRGLAAALAGLLLGGLNGAALVSALETDRARAARLAFAAAAAGLLNPVGAPVNLVLDGWPQLAPVALAMVGVSLMGPSPVEDKTVLPGRGVVSAVLALVGLGAALTEPLWPLLAGCVVLGVLARRELGALPRLLSFSSVVWLAAACALVGFATATGLMWETQKALDYLYERDPGMVYGVFALTVGATLLTGEGFAALAGATILAMWGGGAPDSLRWGILLGVAVGGMDPLFVSGGVARAGFTRWLARVAVAVGWLALFV